jgi:hypothetical protein
MVFAVIFFILILPGQCNKAKNRKYHSKAAEGWVK